MSKPLKTREALEECCGEELIDLCVDYLGEIAALQARNDELNIELLKREAQVGRLQGEMNQAVMDSMAASRAARKICKTDVKEAGNG